MPRANKPRLVQPQIAHEAHLASRLDITSLRRLARGQDELASDKTRKPTAPVLAGAVGDGSALRNLTSLMHEAGLVEDQTVLGFEPGGQTSITPHKHDLAVFRFANSNKDTTPVLVDQDAGQVLWTFPLPLTTGVTYAMLADVIAEGYCEVGSTVEVRLGIQIDSNAVDWGSSTSSENESSPVAASTSAHDYVATGDATITVWARREVTTAQCWIRSGHAKAFAVEADTLGAVAT